jgi:hypothetical protein
MNGVERMQVQDRLHRPAFICQGHDLLRNLIGKAIGIEEHEPTG